MENLTEDQREIAKLKTMLDVCRRDKDALRYQLEEAKRKAAEHSAHLTAFGAGWRGRLGKWLVSLGNRIGQNGGK